MFLFDHSGGFCNTWFQTGAANDTNPDCNECVLKTVQMQLNSPFDYTESLTTDFSNITSSCSASGYPITSPAPISIST